MKKSKPTNHLIDRLRLEAKEQGLTAHAVAKLAGMSSPSIYRLFDGTRDAVTIQTFERIAAALGLEIELKRK